MSKRKLNTPFRLNGKIYVRRFAWLPIKTHEGEWLWLVIYYQFRNKRKELVTISQLEYIVH